jgi:hypothetical protein
MIHGLKSETTVEQNLFNSKSVSAIHRIDCPPEWHTALRSEIAALSRTYRGVGVFLYSSSVPGKRIVVEHICPSQDVVWLAGPLSVDKVFG